VSSAGEVAPGAALPASAPTAAAVRLEKPMSKMPRSQLSMSSWEHGMPPCSRSTVLRFSPGEMQRHRLRTGKSLLAPVPLPSFRDCGARVRACRTVGVSPGPRAAPDVARSRLTGAGFQRAGARRRW
jgi:hypothetical protein